MPITNADIMAKLGEVTGELGEMRGEVKGVKRELDSAAESRRGLYAKMDDQGKLLAETAFAVTSAAAVAAQAREEIKNLRTEITQQLATDIKPTVEEWKTIRKVGLGIVSLIAVGGISIGAILVWFGDAASKAVRSWLHIP